jgi:hypothetical protein
MKSVTHLGKKLSSLTAQQQKLIQKKDDCVNAQNAYENEFFTTDLVTCRKYQKLIELDFELAEKIKDISQQIKNIKAQISRAEKKALLCN